MINLFYHPYQLSADQSKLEILKYILFEIFNHPREWKSYQPRIIDPEHFWEIGIEEVKLDDVVSLIENEKLTMTKHLRNEFNSLHHFFCLSNHA